MSLIRIHDARRVDRESAEEFRCPVCGSWHLGSPVSRLIREDYEFVPELDGMTKVHVEYHAILCPKCANDPSLLDEFDRLVPEEPLYEDHEP